MGRMLRENGSEFGQHRGRKMAGLRAADGFNAPVAEQAQGLVHSLGQDAFHFRRAVRAQGHGRRLHAQQGTASRLGAAQGRQTQHFGKAVLMRADFLRCDIGGYFLP